MCKSEIHSSFTSNQIVMSTENDREETIGSPEISGTISATGRSLAGKQLRKVNGFSPYNPACFTITVRGTVAKHLKEVIVIYFT